VVEVTVIIVVPGERPVAKPLLSIVATDVFDEVQMASVLILRLVWSLKYPVAVNCWLTPEGMLGLTGVKITPLRATDPAQVVKDTAKNPRNNMAKANLKFFMKTSPA
jgi:hypothetical protein